MGDRAIPGLRMVVMYLEDVRSGYRVEVTMPAGAASGPFWLQNRLVLHLIRWFCAVKNCREDRFPQVNNFCSHEFCSL
jgi:hypothetical protein